MVFKSVKPLISVIVPAYNAELTIDACAESIINQTYDNLDIIFINDGSTDNTKKELKKYSEQDSRVTVVNQKNQGVSSARNAGLDIARGDLVIFVDSDDTINPELCEIIAIEFTNTKSDVYITGYNFISKNKKTSVIHPGIDSSTDMKNFESDLVTLVNNRIFLSPSSKAYNLNIIKKHKIRFRGGISLGEDLLFNMDYFLNIHDYRVIDFIGYNYILNSKKSLSTNTSINRLDNNVMLLNKCENFCKKVDIFNGTAGIFAKYYLKSQMYAIDLILSSSKTDKSKKIEAIQKLIALSKTKPTQLMRPDNIDDMEWKVYRKVFASKSVSAIKLLSATRRLVKGFIR